jgi:hypothetical protein
MPGVPPPGEAAGMATSWRARRPLRASIEAMLLGTGYLALGPVLFPPEACTSRQTAPYPCLVGELLYVVAGVPLVTLGIAWALRGKGALHSVVGAVVCVTGSLRLATWLAELGVAESDRAAGTLIVVIGGAGAWLWAAFAPGRTTAS